MCQETIEILSFKRFLERLNVTEKVPQDNKLEEREEAGMTDCHILHCNLKNVGQNLEDHPVFDTRKTVLV